MFKYLSVWALKKIKKMRNPLRPVKKNAEPVKKMRNMFKCSKKIFDLIHMQHYPICHLHMLAIDYPTCKMLPMCR